MRACETCFFDGEISTPVDEYIENRVRHHKTSYKNKEDQDRALIALMRSATDDLPSEFFAANACVGYILDGQCSNYRFDEQLSEIVQR